MLLRRQSWWTSSPVVQTGAPHPLRGHKVRTNIASRTSLSRCTSLVKKHQTARFKLRAVLWDNSLVIFKSGQITFKSKIGKTGSCYRHQRDMTARYNDSKLGIFRRTLKERCRDELLHLLCMDVHFPVFMIPLWLYRMWLCRICAEEILIYSCRSHRTQMLQLVSKEFRREHNKVLCRKLTALMQASEYCSF